MHRTCTYTAPELLVVCFEHGNVKIEHKIFQQNLIFTHLIIRKTKQQGALGQFVDIFWTIKTREITQTVMENT